MPSSKKPIHPSIKKILGYSADLPDKQFLEAWKKRSTIVCKPCWELKYCPYGPFVEQSPLLPSSKANAIAHNEYIKGILDSGFLGVAKKLCNEEIDEIKILIESAKKDPGILAHKVSQELLMEAITKVAEKEGKSILDYLKPPTSGFERYMVPYPLDGDNRTVDIDGMFKEAIEAEIARLEEVVKTGIDDQRKPLDSARRKLFESEVSSFNENEYPEEIPQIVHDSECRNFGHICPVVFVGESITETTDKRRHGRYIPFSTKIRVVRRDNYTCQVCGTHLKDNEVEFDHIIPHSKGGSSEEHNIRLTCFTCNRDKSDNVDI